MDYIFLIAGLSLLLLSANYLVDSSVAIAKRAKISNFIIGLTIVGMGTSAPELFISVKSALTGHGDMAVGNVVGSNIANILLILGCTAAICPFVIKRENQLRDIPFGIAATLLLVLIINDSIVPGISENTLSRVDGVFILFIFLLYMGYSIWGAAKNPQEALETAEESTETKLEGKKPVLLWAIAIVSLVCLIWGGNMFLDSATNLAKAWGMSEAVISISIVAIGTSLPELITAIVAASKKNPELALGNVLGSNVFNILFILGTTATISPITSQGVTFVDFGVMLIAAVMTWIVSYTFKTKTFDRIEGFIFLAMYFGYMAYLFNQ